MPASARHILVETESVFSEPVTITTRFDCHLIEVTNRW